MATLKLAERITESTKKKNQTSIIFKSFLLRSQGNERENLPNLISWYYDGHKRKFARLWFMALKLSTIKNTLQVVLLKKKKKKQTNKQREKEKKRIRMDLMQ